jgi:hypothetical protein
VCGSAWKGERIGGISGDAVSFLSKQRENSGASGLARVQGSDILHEIALMPHWKIGLDCERELLACRHERRPD